MTAFIDEFNSIMLKSNAPLYIFCGGSSRRMGRDKAQLVLDGETLEVAYLDVGKNELRNINNPEDFKKSDIL